MSTALTDLLHNAEKTQKLREILKTQVRSLSLKDVEEFKEKLELAHRQGEEALQEPGTLSEEEKAQAREALEQIHRTLAEAGRVHERKYRWQTEVEANVEVITESANRAAALHRTLRDKRRELKARDVSAMHEELAKLEREALAAWGVARSFSLPVALEHRLFRATEAITNALKDADGTLARKKQWEDAVAMNVSAIEAELRKLEEAISTGIAPAGTHEAGAARPGEGTVAPASADVAEADSGHEEAASATESGPADAGVVAAGDDAAAVAPMGEADAAHPAPHEDAEAVETGADAATEDEQAAEGAAAGTPEGAGTSSEHGRDRKKKKKKDRGAQGPRPLNQADLGRYVKKIEEMLRTRRPLDPAEMQRLQARLNALAARGRGNGGAAEGGAEGSAAAKKFSREEMRRAKIEVEAALAQAEASLGAHWTPPVKRPPTPGAHGGATRAEQPSSPSIPGAEEVIQELAAAVEAALTGAPAPEDHAQAAHAGEDARGGDADAQAGSTDEEAALRHEEAGSGEDGLAASDQEVARIELASAHAVAFQETVDEEEPDPSTFQLTPEGLPLVVQEVIAEQYHAESDHAASDHGESDHGESDHGESNHAAQALPPREPMKLGAIKVVQGLLQRAREMLESGAVPGPDRKVLWARFRHASDALRTRRGEARNAEVGELKERVDALSRQARGGNPANTRKAIQETQRAILESSLTKGERDDLLKVLREAWDASSQRQDSLRQDRKRREEEGIQKLGDHFLRWESRREGITRLLVRLEEQLIELKERANASTSIGYRVVAAQRTEETRARIHELKGVLEELNQKITDVQPKLEAGGWVRPPEGYVPPAEGGREGGEGRREGGEGRRDRDGQRGGREGGEGRGDRDQRGGREGGRRDGERGGDRGPREPRGDNRPPREGRGDGQPREGRGDRGDRGGRGSGGGAPRGEGEGSKG